MTRSAAAPLPVLYLPPPDSGTLAELLLHEVAACVAAVGHRLHVASRPAGTVREAVSGFSAAHGREPVMVLIGRLNASEPAAMPADSGAVPVAAVALDGTAPADGSTSMLTLPARSRSLCRLLARSADARGALPGRAAVLIHHGPGPGGDDGWPGLSWGLTLLLGGPGRAVLVDLQGPGGRLGHRLRTASDTCPPVDGMPSQDAAPGPALASRLPTAGPVRWWSMTGGPAELLAGIGTAADTFRWTVLDAGRNRQLAAELAAGGLPLLTATAQGEACRLGMSGGPTDRRPDRLAVDPAPWTGSTAASWYRAARRRASIDLAARLTAALSPAPAGARR